MGNRKGGGVNEKKGVLIKSLCETRIKQEEKRNKKRRNISTQSILPCFFSVGSYII